MTNEELQALCDLATSGPWVIEKGNYTVQIVGGRDIGSIWICTTADHEDDIPIGEKDAAFIAASRTEVPHLLEQVAALTQQNATYMRVAQASSADYQKKIDALTAELRRLEECRAQDFAQWEKLEEANRALAAERDAARLALAEVKRYWWPAFDKMSQATKDEIERAMWLVRDGALQAPWKE